MTRTILAAPKVGMVHGTFGATKRLLLDRQENGDAFEGEKLVRVPRRMVRDRHGEWLLERSLVEEAALR